MKVAVIGASGLIGSALVPFLKNKGHDVLILKRGEFDFQDSDAVINLAGASISKRWTTSYKKTLVDSRVETTKRLLASHPPKIILNASAIGFYGSRGEEVLDESSTKGTGFLSDLVEMWEDALVAPSCRVVFLRFGVVMSQEGGALKQCLLPFKLGLGGNLGSGKQWMSFVAIQDVLSAILHILETPSLSGPINIVSPQAVRNAEFTKALGKTLHRPSFIPMPEFVIRLIFGEMGEELLLASTKVTPKKLLLSGFTFQYPSIDSCLEACIQFDTNIRS